MHEQLDQILASVPPEVAERVRQRWAEDQEAFLLATEEATPSRSPDYWASRNCKHCYGRGVLGVARHADGREDAPVCRCVDKNYRKWLVSFRKYYNALRAIAREHGYER